MTDEKFSVYRACQSLKIDKAIYLRIASRALDQTTEELETLRQANQSNDVATVQAISHRLKGDYANLRMDYLSEIARQINILSKQEYDQQKAAELIDNFENQYNETLLLLKENIS